MAEQLEQQQTRSAGKVLWFNGLKGFGFIRPDDGGEDLFVHQSSIKSDGYRCLAEGEFVEFIVSQGNGGKTQAVDVTAIGGSPITKKDRRSGGAVGFGGGRRGGNDRRNGSGGCYNCGDLNHLARDCTNNASDYNDNNTDNNAPNGNGGGGGSCYNCGEAGHFARECRRDSGGAGGPGKCYNCGKYGHFARDCNRNSGGSGGCFTCGGFGHLARDCDNNRGTECFKCGEAGHYARECPNLKASA